MLNDLLGPLGGTADLDDAVFRYRDINSDDEQVIKEIISESIKPYFDARSKGYQDSVKLNLSYYLSTKKIDFGRLYDSCLIAFDHSSKPVNFFIWIWEVLFPNEDYYVIDDGSYIEVEDINEPRSYW